jgi:hypothetical protein
MNAILERNLNDEYYDDEADDAKDTTHTHFLLIEWIQEWREACFASRPDGESIQRMQLIFSRSPITTVKERCGSRSFGLDVRMDGSFSIPIVLLEHWNHTRQPSQS